MKIILFGSTGMLGRYVKEYLFRNFHHIVCIHRQQFDIESEDWDLLNRLLEEQELSQQDIILNCSGAIPQQGICSRRFIQLNTLFPRELNRWALQHGCHFIHITTDCVFSGIDGNYNENSIHDAQDIYGITKSLGEEKQMCILRTSIIGEEQRHKNSLLEWVLQQKGKKIDGYECFLWNGITCLQLAKIIEHIIRNNCLWKGVRHFYSPQTVSKYKLCKIIDDVYQLHITIHKKRLPCKNMTLTSIYEFPTGVFIPSIQEQIREQQDFSFKYLFPL